MRIGIITYWESEDNYGQLMQCYASQRYLRSLGHDAFLIRYKHVSRLRPNRSFVSLLKKILNPVFLKNKIKQIVESKRKEIINKKVLCHNINRNFEFFRQTYLKYTEKVYYEKDLLDNPPACDILICGSDQIWIHVPIDPIYFLQFGSANQKRIALSASFGLKSFPKESLGELSEYLKTFDFISVRERSGVEICKLANRFDVQLMCDPTILNGVTEYAELAEGIKLNNEIFVYYLGHKSAVTEKQLVKFLDNKDFLFCASQGLVSTTQKIYPTIPQWLGYIRDSSFVITNSFHGVVFCLLFKKRFAVIPLKNTGANDRIETLLDELELSSRICKDINQIAKAMDNEIDYDVVYPKLELIRERGQILLKGFLCNLS